VWRAASAERVPPRQSQGESSTAPYSSTIASVAGLRGGARDRSGCARRSTATRRSSSHPQHRSRFFLMDRRIPRIHAASPDAARIAGRGSVRFRLGLVLMCEP
jgi:hypothetical protein